MNLNLYEILINKNSQKDMNPACVLALSNNHECYISFEKQKPIFNSCN